MRTLDTSAYPAFATVRMTTTDRFTTADLDRLDLPEGWRAEIIDGALYMSKAPGWDHCGAWWPTTSG
jgi:hypothetical protein